VVASRVLTSVTIDMEKWHAVRASVLAFVAQPQYWDYMSILIGLVLGFIAGSLTVWGMQRRLEAFGDLLTVALAHRRLEAFGNTGPWIKNDQC
jgi:hypothetical protein